MVNYTLTDTVSVLHCVGYYKPQPLDTKVVVPLYDDN
jgi:hypothetical protein